MNVDFGNSKAYFVNSKETRELVFLECEKIFGIPLKRDTFPGSQPVAIEKKDIPLRQTYMICEKTDGERAVLLILHINNKPMCFMMNRKDELHFLDFSFRKEVFEGSIFDGEIIKTKENVFNFLIHDCMAYNGTSFLDASHRLRYACGLDFIMKRYNPNPTDPLCIKTKIFYAYGPEIVKTYQHIQQTTENKIDGLIFTPVDKGIVFGRDRLLFKWKELHTIDFLVKLVSKKINLYYYKKNLTVYISFKPDSKNYKHIINHVKEDETVDLEKGVIMEFKINGDIYEIYKIRTDKSKPNGEITVVNTIKNIEESIKISELI